MLEDRRDRAGDVEHARRVGVAAVEDPPPGPLGAEPDELGEVVDRRRVEAARAPVREGDEAAPVEDPLDEVQLPRERGVRPVHRAGTDDGRPQGVPVEQGALDGDLLRRVRLVAGGDRALPLADRAGEVGEVVGPRRLVEGASLGVGVHRRARDDDDRADASGQGQELLRMRPLVGDRVDDDVGLPDDVHEGREVPVDPDEVRALRDRTVRAGGEVDLPARAEQPPSDRVADLPRPADDERSPCHPISSDILDIMGRRRVGFGVEETAPLFARIPKSEAEKLSRAARTLGTSKQRIIAGLLAEHLEPLAPGAHEFRPLAAQQEVLTLEEAADLLRSAPAAVEELALGGELPARRIGGEWRFARTAVLDWLRGWDQAVSGSGTSPRARPASR